MLLPEATPNPELGGTASAALDSPYSVGDPVQTQVVGDVVFADDAAAC